MKSDAPVTIPEWINRWFPEPMYGPNDQDWDLILMDRDCLPRMVQYLESSDGVLDKKFTIVSALAEMLFLERGDNPESHIVSRKIADEIKSVLAKNKDLALCACPRLGFKTNFLVLMITGSPLPADISR